jgi:hypothetical protein
MLLRLGMLLPLILLPMLHAQEHVVAPSDLTRELASSSQARQRNQAALERFFTSGAARTALRSVRLDPAKVTQAIPYLTDEELARLAARADALDSSFAGAGVSLTNTQVTYIIIGVIAIAIIAIVASR